MFKYIIRCFIVLSWIGLIYIFLMLPYFLKKNDDNEKYLRIYTWAHRIDESVLQDFEAKTGIKVYLNYYESAEELLTKLEIMPSMDCDMMIPSNYIIERLIESKLIKKLDKSRCPFISKIYPQFLNLHVDLENKYSIPMYWDVFGIGYNQLMVGDRPVNLDMLFDHSQIVGNEIGMTDEPREAIFLAAQYLKFDLDHLGPEQFKKIRNLLRRQKSWVGAYTDSQQGYFLASDTFAVVASDREIVCKQMLNNDFVKFAVLPGGSMRRIDSIVINAATKKDDLIYQFLEYLFSYDVLLYHAQKFCILPTTQDVFESLDFKYIGVPDLYPGSQLFNELIAFNLNMTQKEINDFWMRFKAA